MTSESEILSAFLKVGKKSLLAHPLVETFIHLKGMAISNFSKVNLLTFLFFLVSLTCLVDWTSGLKYDRQDSCAQTANAGLNHSGCHSYKEEESAAEGWMLVYNSGEIDL